jgi:hypothetical protein
MRRHRTTARGTLVPLLLAAGLTAGSIAASLSAQPAHASEQVVPRIVFPLVAKTLLWDNYGDPRPNGRHAGIDMENPWRAPVVAAEPGRVEYADSGLGGCMLYLYGRSGTMYLYIHLNNDAGPRNDNTAGCVEGTAYAVPDRSKVLAGQQIAFVGDSGDANGNPHLHFEVHPKGGSDVDPFPYLRKATKVLFGARPGSVFSLGLRGRVAAASGIELRVSVSSVRFYPGGRWLAIDPREIALAVSPSSTVESRVPRGTREAPLGVADLAKQAYVAVYTAKAKVTRATLVGAPGTLTANRVSSLVP